MRRCFQLAQKGAGSVAPNPMVGSVIVAQGKIIGEGWHKQYGQAHAEVNAVKSVKPADKQLLKEATIYVNLEPCSHHGKTPPCVNLILEHNIPKVVICNVDSNPLVGGKGIARLQESGVEVVTGILRKEGRLLNQRFFTSIEKNRPYIILKWAQTADGFFAKNDSAQSWITNENSRRLVHKWRSEEASILIGKNTLLIDNPRLNNRYFEEEKQPVRIVISRKNILQGEFHLLDESQQTIVVNQETEGGENILQYWQFEFNNDLIFNLLERLSKQKVQSFIVEGGATTLQQFIDQNLWDEARVLTGNTCFEKGMPTPTIQGELIKEFVLDKDTVSIYKNT